MLAVLYLLGRSAKCPIDSPKYGQHLSFDKLNELVYDRKALHAIHKFLNKHGVPKEDREEAPNGDFIRVKADIATIEKMFQAEFHIFRSDEHNVRFPFPPPCSSAHVLCSSRSSVRSLTSSPLSSPSS